MWIPDLEGAELPLAYLVIFVEVKSFTSFPRSDLQREIPSSEDPPYHAFFGLHDSLLFS